MRHSSICSALAGVCCFAVLLIFSGAAVGAAPTGHPDSFLPAEQAKVLQFKAGGHVLGFSTDKVYMVGLGHALIEEFVGASPVMPVAGSSPEPGPSRGSDAEDRGAPTFRGVTYPDLWKGITARYDRTAGGLAESVYVIRPGADVGDIRIRYNVDFSIGGDGGLRFRHPSKKGYFTLSRPAAWQEIDGRRMPVEVFFKDHGNRTLGFAVSARNPDYALVIDPTYQWHTFYGGSASYDYGHGIAVADDGVYVAGTSPAAWLGDEEAPPLHPYSGGRDIVVLKLDASGAYQWHTFYGSQNFHDDAFGIAVADDGVYVTGSSQYTWQGDGNTDPIHPTSGNHDIFVLKLSTSGAYQWHTFYGSSWYDYGRAIAVATDGVFVTGESAYTSWKGDSGTDPIHPFSGDYYNLFVLKLNTSGVYQWHTFYGGSYGRAIAVSVDGVYATGESNGSWLGDEDADPLHPYGGGLDIHVLKLNHAGAYQWHTFYGSSSNDYGYGIAANADGLYVAAHSGATWQGDEDKSPLHSHGGGFNIAVLKLSSAGTYQWHTFYGSGTGTTSSGIAVQSDGIYVIGQSYDSWQGDNDTSPEHPHSVGTVQDIAVLKLSNTGAYQWHTFYGPGGGEGIAVAAYEVYVTGESIDTWQGDGETDPLHIHSGGTNNSDIVILKLFGGPTYTVTYDANGATSGAAPEAQTKLHGQDLILQTNSGNLAKTGYTLAGWNTAADGTGTAYAAGGLYTANEAVTLYALWSPLSTDPVIQVTPNSLNFGSVPPGSYKDLTLTVKNIGTGTLTGKVTASPPFSIVSGGTYSLAAGRSQQVVVRYTAPLQEGSQAGSVTFTGGGGSTIQVTGTNIKPRGLPWLQLLLGN